MLAELRLPMNDRFGSLPAVEDTPKPAVQAAGVGCIPAIQLANFVEIERQLLT